MREQSSILLIPGAAGVVAALILLLSVALTRAGEPIQFSNEKAKSSPTSPQQGVDADLFKSWNKSKASSASPLNSLTPFVAPGRPGDPRELRRLKNVQDEKRNWMLLEPGELQEREDEEEAEFGGRGVAIDDMQDTQDRSYLFYNADQQRNDKVQRSQSRPAESEDQTSKEKRIFGPGEPEKHGAHTVSELNLKNLIDPSQIQAAKLNNNEASLFQFLKETSTPPPDRDRQARRDSFREFINGPQAAPAGGFSDPINYRTDLTQERLNPIVPGRPALDMSTSAKGPDSTRAPLAAGFTPGRPAALPGLTTSPRQPMTGSSFPSPLAIQNDAAKAPRASVMGNGSLFNREAPRRGGL